MSSCDIFFPIRDISGNVIAFGGRVMGDEMPKYLQNEVMAPMVARMLEEIRKTDGVFIGASQSPDAVLENPIAPKFMTNIETFLIFPDPRANKRYYMDDPKDPRPNLGLTQQEFNWVTRKPDGRNRQFSPYEVLVKRKDGQSVILDLNYKPLGKLLKGFDSSAEAVKRAHQLMAVHGDDWKTAFLEG